MAVHITSGTTVANVVSTVTFANWYGGIEIDNRSTFDIWATVDGTTPTIAGDECLYIGPNSFITVHNGELVPEPASGVTSNTTVKLISSGAAAYTVNGGV